MGLSIRDYGIHGANEAMSIGNAASPGCIRMGKTDLEEFFKMVSVGATVKLIGQRNEETAQLFVNPQNPAAPPIANQVLAVKAPPSHCSKILKPPASLRTSKWQSNTPRRAGFS
jgi:hypothetical protein